MKTAELIHIQQKDALSEIQFLKKELQFLLKILQNCYSTKMNPDKIKLLDTYWKSFEQRITELNTIQTRIDLGEIELTYLYKNELIEPNTFLLNDPLLQAVKKVGGEVKILKESFYEFMQGCNACAHKSA